MSSKLFTKFLLACPRGPLELSNRIAVAPMCQYSSIDGAANDWHLFHWSNMLNSGAGLVILEATAVNPVGRITPNCLGLWNDHTQQCIKENIERAKALSPTDVKLIIQLAHAGRKGSSAIPWLGGSQLDISDEKKGWQTVAPSALPLIDGERPPHALTHSDIENIICDFRNAASRANDIGFDGIELHAAHGYLIHQFLSPISNHRTDCYGGSLENRMRFPIEVFRAIREVYTGVLGVRVSATDWVDDIPSWDVEQTIQFARALKAEGLDYIHVSSGGVSSQQRINAKPGYQVPFAHKIKRDVGVPTMAVGLITDAHQAENIIANEHADMVSLARSFLYNPRWAWEAAVKLNVERTVSASPQYFRCLPSGAKNVFTNGYNKQRAAVTSIPNTKTEKQ